VNLTLSVTTTELGVCLWNMYVCRYTYICIYIHIYTCIYIYVYTYACVFVCVCVYVRTPFLSLVRFAHLGRKGNPTSNCRRPSDSLSAIFGSRKLATLCKQATLVACILRQGQHSLLRYLAADLRHPTITANTVSLSFVSFVA